MVHDYAVTILKKHGAVVTPVDLEALKLPVYDPNIDNEKTFPEAAQKFKNQLIESGTQET